MYLSLCIALRRTCKLLQLQSLDDSRICKRYASAKDLMPSSLSVFMCASLPRLPRLCGNTDERNVDEHVAAQRWTNSRSACKTSERSHGEAHQKNDRDRTHVQLKIAVYCSHPRVRSSRHMFARTAVPNTAVRKCANGCQAVHANARTHREAYQKTGRFRTHVHLRLDLRTPRCLQPSGHEC